MPLNPFELGRIAEQKFTKLLLMASRGRIEVAAQLTDDRRRDLECR